MTEQSRVWHVCAVASFPREIPLDPGGVLPAKIEPISRIPAERRDMGRVRLLIERYEDPIDLGTDQGPREPAAISFRVTGTDASAALSSVEQLIKDTIEALSFQLQASSGIVQLEVLDTTPPLEVGQEREGLWFPPPQGYAVSPFQRASIPLGSVLTRRTPTVGLTLSHADTRTRRAIDWYLKGIHAPLAVDQFIFLWIATEILWEASDVVVNEPYVAACGHSISACPECGRATDRLVRGASLREFFVQLGVDHDVARRLWDLRQVVHGAVQFDSAEMEQLPELSQWLRALVLELIKLRCGLPSSDPPRAGIGGLLLQPGFALVVRRQVNERDVALAARLAAS